MARSSAAAKVAQAGVCARRKAMGTAGGVAVFTTGCSKTADRAPCIEAAASFLSALALFVSWQLHHIRAPQQPIYAHLKAVRDLRQPIDVQRL